MFQTAQVDLKILFFSVCLAGFEGKFCEKTACKCSNNGGVCLKGKCVCFHSYTGADCSQPLAATATKAAAPSLCSDRGDFDYARKECRCQRGWLAPDCAQHENCLDRECRRCRNGWSGAHCRQQVPLSCDRRCNEHGICVNGTCNCSPGFQGRNCDISESNWPLDRLTT